MARSTITAKQQAYIKDLVSQAGFENVESALDAIATAGEGKHKNNAAARVRKAVVLDKRTFDELTIRDAAGVISALRSPDGYEVVTPRSLRDGMIHSAMGSTQQSATEPPEPVEG